ncbi:DUF6318 family protein [Paeniglutamicibacter sp. MACA_103]|uniref:DUF6318 family protein n=1 Tax=Paeniglutamicibacter sp. MACA_103 TaxID=3377337 RepID=UPI0038959C4D
MFTKIKQVIVVFCSGALLLAAAGCSGNADPAEPTNSAPTSTPTTASSPPTTSPSPTAKPTPKPIPASSKGPGKNWQVPKMPEAAKQKSEQGIKAFATYYYDLVEYTIQTNDTKPIKKITTRSCVECGEVFIDPFDNNKKAGSWIAGATFDVFDVVVTKTILQADHGIALYTTAQEEMTLYMSDGTLQGVFPAMPKPAPVMMQLHYERGWMVDSVEYLDEKS